MPSAWTRSTVPAARERRASGGQDADRSTAADFDKAVNMGAAELARWLRTPESTSVGFSKTGASESVGHR